jgi:hypothetical protein
MKPLLNHPFKHSITLIIVFFSLLLIGVMSFFAEE